ncbi:hypothetical protein ACPCKW_23220 [Streptomyces griseoincarnatus]
MVGFLARTRQDPRADTAFRLATTWARGQKTIHDVRALGHAINVANTLGRYTPDVPPQAVAACLLHAIPQWPLTDEAAHQLVEEQCGPEARWLLEALRSEHTVLEDPSGRAVEGHLRQLRTMPWLAHATLAFKIVMLQYAPLRAVRTSDTGAAGPFEALQANQLSYLDQVHALTTGLVPQIMTTDFGRLLEQRRPVTTAASR